MFTYILSSRLDYQLLICDDAGPNYASSMNWTTLYLDDINEITQEVLIIDNRLAEAELEEIERMVINHPKTKFFFRIVDPYGDLNRDHYYYQFVVYISKKMNTYLLSTYQPKEIVIIIKKKYEGRYITIPYPYIKDKEIPELVSKKNKIIISGSINSAIYPYRTSIWRKVTRSVTRFVFFSILRHPGYIDINPKQSQLHNIVKDKFVHYLSGFKYMLMCPSRCGIELLKYSELAYAGCIPVGLPPDSYPDHIKKLFLTLRKDHFLNDLFKIIFKKHSKHTIKELRAFMHDTRNPNILNKLLQNFINE